MIQQAIQNIDSLFILSSAGIEMKKVGKNYVGLCPLHTEKTPSFTLYEKNGVQILHCFGCLFHGNIINFTMKYYNLSFPDALKHLGIEQGPITPKIKQDIAKRKRRAELVRQFRQWEWDYCTYISDLWHKTKRLMMNGIPPDDLELYAPLFHMLPVWEYHREILIHGTDKEKYKLYKEAQSGKYQYSG